MKAKQNAHPSAIICDTVAHSRSSSRLGDARAAKSSHALQLALLALLERKPFEQVTVREIAVEAGVHYATFFRHHPTKEALLEHVATEQIHRLVALALPTLDIPDSLSGFLALCTYVSEHRTLWTVLLTGGAAATMREELLRISRSVAAEIAPKDAWIPLDLAVNCSVGLIVETLAWWLAEPAGTVTIEQVATILHRLVTSLQQPVAG